MKKNISKVIAVLVVLCVLVTTQLCTLAEDTNTGISGKDVAVSQEDELLSSLKDSWKAMYKKTDIAKFDSNSMFMNQHTADYTSPSEGTVRKVTFNSEGFFTVEKYSKTKNFGLTFNKGENVHFISNIADNSFNDAFNNDSLYFTFNPGTVTAAGNLEVMLQYNSWADNGKFYAEIPFTADDTNKDIPVKIENLEFICCDSNYSNTFSFDNLSAMLTNPIEGVDTTLVAIKIGFSTGTLISNAKISSFEGKKNAELPEGIDALSTVEIYNQAVAAEIDGYENTEGFVAARTALYNYLHANNQEFIVSELKGSWSKLSKDETVAAFDFNSKIMNQNNAVSSFEESSSMGINFNNNGTFDKAQHSNHFNGNYQLYGMTFNVNVDEENKLFTSEIDSFNNAFSNDSLYFTFNPGTVTKGAEIWVLLQYNGTGAANVLRSQIPITVDDSGRDIKVVIKDLTYNCRSISGYDNTKFSKLSDALKNPVNGLNTDLCAIKIFFHHDLVATGASISGLKYTKSETVPEDTDSEILTGKALRVDANYYGNVATEFIAQRDNYYNFVKGNRVLGDVNTIQGVNICDLVFLENRLTAFDYDKENDYLLLGDFDVDGYVDSIDLNKLQKALLG